MQITVSDVLARGGCCAFHARVVSLLASGRVHRQMSFINRNEYDYCRSFLIPFAYGALDLRKNRPTASLQQSPSPAAFCLTVERLEW